MMESIGTDAKPMEVLLVEDSPAMYGLRERRSKTPKCTSTCPLRRMGRKQWTFLSARGTRERPSPESDLADLNLPKKDGRGFGGNQGESDAEEYSRRYLDHLGV